MYFLILRAEQYREGRDRSQAGRATLCPHVFLILAVSKKTELQRQPGVGGKMPLHLGIEIFGLLELIFGRESF